MSFAKKEEDNFEENVNDTNVKKFKNYLIDTYDQESVKKKKQEEEIPVDLTTVKKENTEEVYEEAIDLTITTKEEREEIDLSKVKKEPEEQSPEENCINPLIFESVFLKEEVTMDDIEFRMKNIKVSTVQTEVIEDNHNTIKSEDVDVKDESTTDDIYFVTEYNVDTVEEKYDEDCYIVAEYSMNKKDFNQNLMKQENVIDVIDLTIVKDETEDKYDTTSSQYVYNPLERLRRKPVYINEDEIDDDLDESEIYEVYCPQLKTKVFYPNFYPYRYNHISVPLVDIPSVFQSVAMTLSNLLNLRRYNITFPSPESRIIKDGQTFEELHSLAKMVYDSDDDSENKDENDNVLGQVRNKNPFFCEYRVVEEIKYEDEDSVWFSFEDEYPLDMTVKNNDVSNTNNLVLKQEKCDPSDSNQGIKRKKSSARVRKAYINPASTRRDGGEYSGSRNVTNNYPPIEASGVANVPPTNMQLSATLNYASLNNLRYYHSYLNYPVQSQIIYNLTLNWSEKELIQIITDIVDFPYADPQVMVRHVNTKTESQIRLFILRKHAECKLCMSARQSEKVRFITEFVAFIRQVIPHGSQDVVDFSNAPHLLKQLPVQKGVDFMSCYILLSLVLIGEAPCSLNWQINSFFAKINNYLKRFENERHILKRDLMVIFNENEWNKVYDEDDV